MANLGYVSTFNINGNELSLKDAALTEIVSEIIEAIGANNTNIAERINDLHNRSFDNTIKISSQNESEIASIQDGLYKLQYVTVTGEGDNATETLNNSAILIQKGTNQYLYKDGQLSSRTKTNSTWGNWITFKGGVTSVNGMTGAVTLSIPDAQIQADWKQTTTTAKDYIKNKPNIITGVDTTDIAKIIFNNFNNVNINYDGGNYDSLSINAEMISLNATDTAYYKNKEIAVKDDIKVTSVNGATGAVITQLSDDYAPSSEVNENLELAAGDTYEEAFGKLHKAILDNEQVVAGTLADFDERLDTVEDDINNLATVATSGDYDDLIGKPTIPENVSDLNNDLGFITQAPVTSVNGATGAVTITETQLSKGTATGTGNAVTDINVSNHQITLVKGATYTTQEDVNQSIAALVDSAPETLNTLNELAEALGNDENFATTVATQIGQKYTKPSTGIPASDLADGVILQSDWNQTNTTANDYIKNKPNISTTDNNTYIGSGNQLILLQSNDVDASSIETFYLPTNTYIGNYRYEAPVITSINVNGTPANIRSKIAYIDIPTKTSDLTNDSGFITNVPVTSVNGQTGAVTLTLGDTNVIETVKVNNTALTPDANKAVNITVPTKTSDLTNDSGFLTQAPVTSVNGQTGTATVKENVQSDWNATTGDAVILNKPTIPTVNDSTVTLTMNGNTVGTFTLNKSGNTTIDLGTVLTSHQSLKTINNESIIGTGNITISGGSSSGLPSVTAADNGKVLMVVNGEWTLVNPVSLYSGSGTPDNSQGNNGDIYVQS